jgi:ankyrin repeat protein
MLQRRSIASLYVVRWGREAVVKLLLGQEVITPNLLNKSGRTPLLRAAEGGHASMVKLFLDHKDVNVNQQDNEERTPLLCAARY